MSEKKRRTCNICGRPYVPTSNVQKYCPDCRKELTKSGSISDAYKAYKKAGAPGPVTVSHIETPEDMLQQTIEVRDKGEGSGGPELGTFIIYPPNGYEGNGGGGKTSEDLDTAQIATVLNKRPCVVQAPTGELPDGLAVIEEHAEILRRYYRGELIDKEEFLNDLHEKLDNL